MGKKEKLIIGVIATLAIIITVSSCYRACHNENKLPSVSSNKKSKKSQKKQKPLKVALFPSGDPRILVEIWQPVADYLIKELKMPVELVFGSSYDDTIKLIKYGKVELALLGSYAYIRACQETKITPLVRRIKYGSSDYHSIIITRKDSEINKIEDLKGKSIFFTDKDSTSGYFLPMAWLKKNDIDPNSYLSKWGFAQNNDSAIIAVSNEIVDAVAIASSWWQDPRQKNKVKDLKKIWESESVPLGPFCVRNELDEKLTEKIRKALLKIGKTQDTQGLLKHLKNKRGIDGFEEAMDSDYDIIRNLIPKDVK